MMPASPTPSLVFVQAHVALFRLEFRFNMPSGAVHTGQGLQGSVPGIGTSRPLLPGASGRMLITGGSWLSRRSLRRRERASETRSPVLSMIR